MAEYKLLKDLPGKKAGEIIERYDGFLTAKFNLNDKNRFEEIKEREIVYPANLMKGWLINQILEAINIKDSSSNGRRDVARCLYILGNRFPTEEKAEQYIALKKHVALMGDTNKEDRVYSLLIDDNTRWQQTKMNKTYFFYLNKDFMMPLNSTLEELAERENLLRSYYDF